MIFLDIFDGTFKGILLGISLWTTTTIIICLMFGIIFNSIDMKYSDVIEGEGIVIMTNFIPSYDEVTVRYNIMLKTPLPEANTYDDEWKAIIKVGDLFDCINVDEVLYNKIKLNDTVNVVYSKGRIFDSIKIRSISLK